MIGTQPFRQAQVGVFKRCDVYAVLKAIPTDYASSALVLATARTGRDGSGIIFGDFVVMVHDLYPSIKVTV